MWVHVQTKQYWGSVARTLRVRAVRTGFGEPQAGDNLLTSEILHWQLSVISVYNLRAAARFKAHRETTREGMRQF